MITLTHLTSQFLKAAAVLALGSMVTGCVVQDMDGSDGEDSDNGADALTAFPLWIAFVVGRRAANRTYTYGFGRAEDKE